MQTQNAVFKTESRAGPSIGAILIDSGRLTTEGAERILRAQKEQGMRFGDAGLALGVLSQEDIQFALSRQFDYPYLTPGLSKVSQELVAAYKPFSQEVETLRALRSQLMLRWFDNQPERKALAVLSPGRSEGRSHVLANLAIVFSQLGEHTLLIDADMRRPRQHELFGLPNQGGLSTILSGRGGAEAVQRVPDFADLSVLTAGAPPPNPQELLARPVFGAMLEGFGREYDVVLIDTPPAAESADAQTIAVRAGGVMLMARKHHTSQPLLLQLAEGLQQGSAHVVGAMLNEF